MHVAINSSGFMHNVPVGNSNTFLSLVNFSRNRYICHIIAV